MKKIILIISVIFSLSSTVVRTSSLKPGTYGAHLVREDGKQINFTFEIKQLNAKTGMVIRNAEERLQVNDISYAGDSVFIEMPFFDSGFRAKIDQQGNLEGYWIKRGAVTNQKMAFKAIYNEKNRFPKTGSARVNISGRWAVNFTPRSGKPYLSVGEFEQSGSYLTGTFLTSTGDYRYLEGVVSNDSVYLSAFDGGHAFLFVAKVADNDHIAEGQFYSGFMGQEKWEGRKDATAKLPDSYSGTRLKSETAKLDFTFPDLNNKAVSIHDPVFKNKVVVIQIMGSWCPNCMDETNFLSDYYNKNRQKGFEVIALAYERSNDFARSQKLLQPFRQRFNVKYPMLITGVTVTDSMRTEKTLPQLEKIVAFPTSIFVDKSGRVRKIHTGFSGPGTGKHFEEFKKEFEDTINALLAEKV